MQIMVLLFFVGTRSSPDGNTHVHAGLQLPAVPSIVTPGPLGSREFVRGLFCQVAEQILAFFCFIMLL